MVQIVIALVYLVIITVIAAVVTSTTHSDADELGIKYNEYMRKRGNQYDKSGKTYYR